MTKNDNSEGSHAVVARIRSEAFRDAADLVDEIADRQGDLIEKDEEGRVYVRLTTVHEELMGKVTDDKQVFSKEDLERAYAAGFLNACEGHNGECNDFSDHYMTTEEILKKDAFRSEMETAPRFYEIISKYDSVRS